MGPTRAFWITALLLASLSWLVIALAEPHNGPTCDEYRHLTRGIAALRAPTTRLNRPHPPLAEAAAALPVALFANPELEKVRGFETESMAGVVTAFVKRDYASARRNLRSSRLTNAAWSSALLIFLMVWLRRRFDTVTAIGAGLLYATSPIVLAHSGLMTNDFGVGAATLLSLAAIVAYLDDPRWWRLALAALAAATLSIVKISGVVVLLIEIVVPVAWLAMRRGPYSDPRLHVAGLKLLRDYLLIALVVLLGINAAYRFNQTFMTLPELGYDLGFLPHWPRSWRVPLPATYLSCLNAVSQKNEHGHAGSFFGHSSHTGASLYFPFMLLAKSQLLFVPLLVVGFTLDARRMLQGIGKWLLFVALAFLAVAMHSSINIGVRHVMPTLLCLLALGGRATAVVFGFLRSRWPRVAALVAGAGCLSLLAGVGMAFPAYVGDFNVAVGNETGRRGGVIAEDWGQSAGDLGRELQRRGVQSVAYAPRHTFGVADLTNQGVRVQKLGCRGTPGRAGAVAIHLVHWQQRRRCYRGLRKREPDFVVHHDVLVFLTHSKPNEPTQSPRPRRHHKRGDDPPAEAAATVEPPPTKQDDDDGVGGNDVGSDAETPD